jgi:hypothetical protein
MLDLRYRAKINPKYAEFFPDVEPDEVWNNYFDLKVEEYYGEINDPNLLIVLDGYINALNLCTEYHSKPRGGEDSDPKVLIDYDKFLKLKELQPDILFMYIIYRVDKTKGKETSRKYLLQKLTEIKECRYNPLDEFTKKRIQKTFRAFVLKTWGDLNIYYKEFFDD